MDINHAPTTEDEAILLCVHLSEKFKFQCIFIRKSDLEDTMGTENWTEENYDKAIELATDEVAEQVGQAVQNAIEEINF